VAAARLRPAAVSIVTASVAKTDAGVRVVNILPALSDELGDYRGAHRSST
jgi:hypothetical protein